MTFKLRIQRFKPIALWSIPEDYNWIAMMACVWGAFVLGFLAGKL